MLTTGLDTVTGTSGNDTIKGILVTGGVTSDTLTLGDVIDGGAGTDTLSIATSDTTIDTGLVTVTNVETLSINNGSAGLTAIDADSDGYTTLSLDKSNAALTISGVTVQNNTKINVSGAADLTFTTATGTELTIDGSAATGKLGITVVGGNDTITGGSAVDTIDGGAGVDTINGAGGADVITGGAGADNLTGGAGADIFVVGAADATIDAAGVGADKITDFNTGGSDVIRVAAANNVAAADVVVPVAGAAGSIAAGGKLTFATADDTLTEQIVVAIAETGANEVVFWENGSDTYVYFSGAAGDGTNDQMVKLVGVTGLTTITESTTTAGDFTIA